MKKLFLASLIIALAAGMGYAQTAKTPSFTDTFTKNASSALKPAVQPTNERADLLFTVNVGALTGQVLLAGVDFDATLNSWWCTGGAGPWNLYKVDYAGTTYTAYVNGSTWYSPLDIADCDNGDVYSAPYDWEGYDNEMNLYTNGIYMGPVSEITFYSPTGQAYDSGTDKYWVVEAWSGPFHMIDNGPYPGTPDVPYADSMFLSKIGLAMDYDENGLWVFSQTGATLAELYLWDLGSNDYTGDMIELDGTLGTAGGCAIYTDPTYGKALAAMHQGSTDDVIAVYSFAPNPFPKLDIDCNGDDGPIEVFDGANCTVTIDVEARDFAGFPAELWVLGVDKTSGGVFTYGAYPSAVWLPGVCNFFYGGGLMDFAETALDQPLPVGSYDIYLALELLVNGQLNLPFVWGYDMVAITVIVPPTEYKWDSGTTDNLLCWTSGGDMVGMHCFDTIPGGEALANVGTIFGSVLYSNYAPGNGTPTDFYVWEAAGFGDINSAALLTQGTGVVGNVDLDLHYWDACPCTVTTPAFYVAYNLHHAAYEYCLSIDSTNPYVTGAAQYTGTNTMYGFDPNNLFGNQYPPAESPYGFWTVRAEY